MFVLYSKMSQLYIYICTHMYICVYVYIYISSLLDLRMMCTFKKIIYLFLSILDLHCWVGFCLVAESRGYSLLRFAVASLVAEHGL